ncbi:MAG: ABC transporter permease [Patescibacteria group bacterium]
MINSINELWQFRELLVALTLREIKVRYKQTILGMLWAILQPLSLTLIFTFVFGIILKVNSGVVAYPVFAYSALVPWTFFSNSVTFGSLSVVNNGNLVTKVYFPREILPLSSIGAALFDFLMAGIILILILFFYQIPINLNFLLILLIIPSIIFLTAGISFFFSAINVMFRDIRFVIPLLLQIWLYVTPVIYSTNQVPQKYQIFFKLNPLVSLIENFRLVTVYGRSPNLLEVGFNLVLSLCVLVIGYWFFKSREKIFADVI